MSPALAAATASAQSSGIGSGKVRMAASYINRDTGMATENSNIKVPSNCRTPDRYDEAQPVSPAGSTANNVHNDACLLDNRGGKADDGSTLSPWRWIYHAARIPQSGPEGLDPRCRPERHRRDALPAERLAEQGCGRRR